MYDLFSEQVYNTALAYVQNVEEAEEVTQDVFIKVNRYAGSFKGDSAVGTWIYRIAINTALNRVKKNKRSPFLPFGDHTPDKPDFVHPGVLLERKEESKALFAAIDKLSTQQKTAFILSFVEDLPRQKVAEIMELSLKAVESLLQRGKGNLRKSLKKMYPHRRK